VTAYNLNSTSKLTISNTLELHEALGASWLSFDRSASNNDEKRVDDWLDELNKATLLIQLKYSAA
jgi:hypothetical protein